MVKEVKLVDIAKLGRICDMGDDRNEKSSLCVVSYLSWARPLGLESFCC
jgi:hypothetical protein